MENHIVNHCVPRNIRCEHAQGFRIYKSSSYIVKMIIFTNFCISRRPQGNGNGRKADLNLSQINLYLSQINHMISKTKGVISNRKTNNFENLRTRKPIRPLTNQEKQNKKIAPLIFLKDRFRGPAHTINPKTGLRLEQIARKKGTIAKKNQKSGDIWGTIQNCREWLDN